MIIKNEEYKDKLKQQKQMEKEYCLVNNYVNINFLFLLIIIDLQFPFYFVLLKRKKKLKHCIYFF